MVAEQLVVLQFGVIERVLAEDDAGVGRRGRAAADGQDDGLLHVLRLASLQPLQRRSVAAVGRVTQHHHLLLPPVAPVAPGLACQSQSRVIESQSHRLLSSPIVSYRPLSSPIDSHAGDGR